MKIISKDKINKTIKKEIIREILSGKIFIYPTDTIYGIGCNALNQLAVSKLKLIKQRDKDKPLSIIAPSIEWIKNNCIIDINIKHYLPGPYTLILKKKNPKFLSHVSNTDSLGVRIPDNFFAKIIQESGVPFITTSVNLSGEQPITKISEIPKEIKNKIDYIIDSGSLTGMPSTLIVDGKEVRR